VEESCGLIGLVDPTLGAEIQLRQPAERENYVLSATWEELEGFIRGG
jgi:hypothetical protein